MAMTDSSLERSGISHALVVTESGFGSSLVYRPADRGVLDLGRSLSLPGRSFSVRQVLGLRRAFFRASLYRIFAVKRGSGQGTRLSACLTERAPVVAPVPEGIWTALSDDPSPGAKVRSAFLGATLAAPARIGPPEGTVTLTQVHEGALRPLPFIDEIEDRQEFVADVTEAEGYIAAQPTDSEAILLTAASRLARSGSFSVRTFAVDRVAPPRLVPLGEGMVDAVKPAVATAPAAPPPPPPPDPVPGPPRLHALLRASSATATRGAIRTSVAAGFDRFARSAPPTLPFIRCV